MKKFKLHLAIASAILVLVANSEAVTYIVLTAWMLPAVANIVATAISIDCDESWIK